MELRLFFRLCFAIAVASFCLTGHADEKDPMEHVIRHLDWLEGTVDELEEARHGDDARITSLLTRIANIIDEIDKLCVADTDKFFQYVHIDGEEYLRPGNDAEKWIQELVSTLRTQIAAAREHLESERRRSEPQEPFVRGDSNADGQVDVSDVIYTLRYLFLGGDVPGCVKAADVDDNGTVNITDPISLLDVLYLGGSAPPAPFGRCGADPTEDALSCDTYGQCQTISQ